MKKEYKMKTIVKLYETGLSKKEIKAETSYNQATINSAIKKYEQGKSNKRFFNVNEKDCWLIPTSDPATHE